MYQRIRKSPALFVILATASCVGTMAQSGGSAGSTKNPFKDVNFFLNPEYVANVEATAKRHPDMADQIRKVAQYPTAVWLDQIAAVKNLKGWLDEAKKQQDASGKPSRPAWSAPRTLGLFASARQRLHPPPSHGAAALTLNNGGL